MQRIQIPSIKQDLQKKMVFIVGPRQVGKTWISKEIAKSYNWPIYLNYDNIQDRESMKKMDWPTKTDLIILDEVHKMKGWKNYLKGVYDTKPEHTHILVTGSARLNAHKNIGDSLAGRYFVHTIFPFSLSEVLQVTKDSITNKDTHLDLLEERGGFPEPFLASNIEDANRWRGLYVDSLLRTDILDFATIEDVRAMQEVFSILRHSVGSAISYASIARTVGLSSMTVRRYIQVFESLYLIFIIRPYTRKIHRAILKEPKVYFYDTGLVESEGGSRFENIVALALLKNISLHNEATGQTRSLTYIKTKEGKEIDFVISDTNQDIKTLIEAKLSDDHLSKTLIFFKERYAIGKAVQVVRHLRRTRQLDENTFIVPASEYLADSQI